MNAVLRNAQYRAAAANYDNQSPPEPVEHDYTEAYEQIGMDMARGDELEEVVMELHESTELLNWIAHNVNLPSYLLTSFRDLDRRARSVSARAEELVRS